MREIIRYECSGCGLRSDDPGQIMRHEPSCLEKQKERERERQKARKRELNRRARLEAKENGLRLGRFVFAWHRNSYPVVCRSTCRIMELSTRIRGFIMRNCFFGLWHIELWPMPLRILPAILILAAGGFRVSCHSAGKMMMVYVW